MSMLFPPPDRIKTLLDLFYIWCYRVYQFAAQIFPSLTKDNIVWDDLRFPATGINPPGLVSDPTIDITNIGLSFSGSSDERIDIVGQLPHAFKAGTNIKPHIHWTPLSNSAGNVIWQIQYKWFDNNFQEPAAFTYININSVVYSAANFANSRISSFGNVTAPASGGIESSLFKAKILRLGSSDSYTGPALFNEFDIHYQIEKIGSGVEIPTV